MKQAKKYLDSVLKQKPGEFKSQYDDTISDLYNRILNREDFSYDPNKDPMYQIYKNNYMQQGQQAMTDTVGNAAALTGGYGRSYAQTAGQQQYGQYLQQLQQALPEFYGMALDRYTAEGEALEAQTFGVPVQILGQLDAQEIPGAVGADIIIPVTGEAFAREVAAEAARQGKTAV